MGYLRKRNRFRPMRFCSVKEFMWRRSYGSQNRKEIINSLRLVGAEERKEETGRGEGRSHGR